MPPAAREARRELLGWLRVLPRLEAARGCLISDASASGPDVRRMWAGIVVRMLLIWRSRSSTELLLLLLLELEGERACCANWVGGQGCFASEDSLGSFRGRRLAMAELRGGRGNLAWRLVPLRREGESSIVLCGLDVCDMLEDIESMLSRRNLELGVRGRCGTDLGVSGNEGLSAATARGLENLLGGTDSARSVLTGGCDMLFERSRTGDET